MSEMWCCDRQVGRVMMMLCSMIIYWMTTYMCLYLCVPMYLTRVVASWCMMSEMVYYCYGCLDVMVGYAYASRMWWNIYTNWVAAVVAV